MVSSAVALDSLPVATITSSTRSRRSRASWTWFSSSGLYFGGLFTMPASRAAWASVSRSADTPKNHCDAASAPYCDGPKATRLRYRSRISALLRVFSRLSAILASRSLRIGVVAMASAFSASVCACTR